MQSPPKKEPVMMVHLDTFCLVVIAVCMVVLVVWGTNAV
jgi:hypothetical protein